MDQRTRLMLCLALAVAGAITGFVMSADVADDPPSEPEEEHHQQSTGEPSSERGAPGSDARRDERGSPPDVELGQRAPAAAGSGLARAAGAAPSALVRSDSQAPRERAGDQIVEVQGGTQGGWDDPTNDRVLGPKEWMASATDDERARVDEVFEKSRAARYDPRISNQDRGHSVAAMKAVVDACFGALRERTPGVAGRLIVAWTAGAEGGQGRITNPRIKTNYKLEDDAFEACVVDGAQDLRFPASDGDAIEVEAPFFYDGAF